MVLRPREFDSLLAHHLYGTRWTPRTEAKLGAGQAKSSDGNVVRVFTPSEVEGQLLWHSEVSRPSEALAKEVNEGCSPAAPLIRDSRHRHKFEASKAKRAGKIV